MLISHEHKFIFIHIGKTGGTSIEKVLCRHLGLDFDNTKKDPNGNWWKHIWAKDMKQKVGHKIWQNYFTFAFVRNPFDMIVSLYSMYTQYPQYTKPDVHPKLYHPWNQFRDFDALVLGMKNRQHEPDELWRQQLDKLNAKTHLDVWNSLKNLQTSYLTESWQGRNGKGEILVDFVGRFETLEEDFKSVCREISVPALDLIHHGATNHGHYSDCYSEESRDFVCQHFSMDVERFGYSF